MFFFLNLGFLFFRRVAHQTDFNFHMVLVACTQATEESTHHASQESHAHTDTVQQPEQGGHLKRNDHPIAQALGPSGRRVACRAKKGAREGNSGKRGEQKGVSNLAFPHVVEPDPRTLQSSFTIAKILLSAIARARARLANMCFDICDLGEDLISAYIIYLQELL